MVSGGRTSCCDSRERLTKPTDAIEIQDAEKNLVYQNREYLRSIGSTSEESAAMEGPWEIFRDPKSVRREWASAPAAN